MNTGTYHLQNHFSRLLVSCLLATLAVSALHAMQDAQIVWEKPMNQAAGLCSMSAGERWALTIDNPLGAGTKVLIRDMESGDVRYGFHFESPSRQIIKNVVFGRDSTTILLVVEGVPAMIYTLSTSTGVVVDSVDITSISMRLSGIAMGQPFADKQRWILSGQLGLFIFNTETKKTDTVYTKGLNDDSIGNTNGARWIGISQDESQFYTLGNGPGSGGAPERLCAWDAETLDQIYQIEDNEIFTWRPMSNPQSRYIAMVRGKTSSPDQPQGYLYDLRTGMEVRSLPNIGGYDYEYMSLTKDGRYLGYQSSVGQTIHFMDTETGMSLGQYQTTNVVKVIQFLTGTTLEAYIPRPGPNSVRVRVHPTTDTPTEASSNPLRCTVLPNPAVGGTVVKLNLSAAFAVTLRLVASDGIIIQDCNLGLLEAGEHDVTVRAAAGHYQCLVIAGNERSAFPIILR